MLFVDSRRLRREIEAGVVRFRDSQVRAAALRPAVAQPGRRWKLHHATDRAEQKPVTPPGCRTRGRIFSRQLRTGPPEAARPSSPSFFHQLSRPPTVNERNTHLQAWALLMKSESRSVLSI